MSKKNLLQERLTGLFLRLNGYFQTGYIAHSEETGQNGAEIDRLAIRFPRHSQTERGIDSCPILNIPSDSIDLIIAEVKNATLEFNQSIKSGGIRTEDNWNQILNWSGLFAPDEIKELIPKLISTVDNDGLMIGGNFDRVISLNRNRKISIRPMIFSIENEHGQDNSKIWINGNDMIGFIWECLCPTAQREECSTKYNYENWGFEYSDLVSFFKKRLKSGLGIPTLADLYTSFDIP